MAESAIYPLSVYAWAVIGEGDNARRVPVSSASVTYWLDHIPQASIVIPVGKNVTDPEDLTAASVDAQEYLKLLTPMTPCKVYAEFRTDGNRPAVLPAGLTWGVKLNASMLLFDGVLFGEGFTKSILSNGEVGLELFLLGQEAYLGGGSTYLSFAGRAFLKAWEPTNQWGGRYTITVPSTTQIGGTYQTITTAIWDFDIKKLPFSGTLGQRLPGILEYILDQTQRLMPVPQRSIAKQQAALRRINRYVVSLDENKPESVFFPQVADAALQKLLQGQIDSTALPIERLYDNKPGQVATLPPSLAATAIKKELSECFLSTWGGQKAFRPSSGGDYWSVLLGLGERFLFHYVPAVEEAVLAPICFGCQGTPWKVITPQEYYSVFPSWVTSKDFYAYLETVIVSAAHVTQSFVGVDTALGKEYSLGIGIRNREPGKGEYGKVIFYPAPIWLLPVPIKQTQHVLGSKFIIPPNTVAYPYEVGYDAREGVASPDSDIVYKPVPAANYFGQTVLYDELLAHRNLKLAGRFRMDIAPGSLIRVDTNTNLLDANVSEGPVKLFGVVDQVRCSIDCTRGEAFTALNLRNVRTEAEHTGADGMSVEKNPLYYEYTWTGAPLLSGLD